MDNKEKKDFELAQERTLLSAERTFAAWLRTSLTAMAGGIAILRLIHFGTQTHRLIAHIIGEILIIWACALIIMAALNYKKTRNMLVLGQKNMGTHLAFVMILAPILVVSVLLVVITIT